MNLLTQQAKPEAVEAYLRAGGGPLYMGHAGRDLVVSLEDAGFVARPLQLDREVSAAGQGWPTVLEAVNNPVEQPVPPICPGCKRTMIPTITDGFGCPTLGTPNCVRNTKPEETTHAPTDD